MKAARDQAVLQCLEREPATREEVVLHLRQAEEELERKWRQQASEAARKAAEETEQRWRLRSEEVERQLSL